MGEPEPDQQNASAKGGKRLRFSVIDFTSGFTVDRGGKVDIDTAVLDEFQTARADDYTLVNCIFFTSADSSNNANPPDFTKLFQVRGQTTRKARIDYLKKLTTEMHKRHMQVIVGYTLDEGSKADPDDPKKRIPIITTQGKDFRDWLAGADDAKITTHAKQIVDFFLPPKPNDDDKIEIDGINFDLEINGLGSDPKHKPHLAKLFKETARLIDKARTGASVSYDTTTFVGHDGNSTIGFFRIQPYSIAAGTTNLVARPMHNLDHAANKPTIDETISVALKSSSGGGGGLAPGNLQIMLDVDGTGSDEVRKICEKSLQPKRIGLVLYNMKNRSFSVSAMKSFAADLKKIEKALNPAAALPGKKDLPVQAPLAKDLP